MLDIQEVHFTKNRFMLETIVFERDHGNGRVAINRDGRTEFREGVGLG